MKNIIILLVSSFITIVAHAQPVISIVWPMGAGSAAAQYSRILIEELNQTQKKYIFVFENKPGAGASIGARYVASKPNTILSASTAFFVRPNFYPSDSHNISDFKPLLTQCAAPMVIVSKKYSSWYNIDKNQKLSIGISGLGATSHLMAMEISKQYPNMLPIPYKSTSEATTAVVAGHVDLSIAFLGEISRFIDQGNLFALGISGDQPVKGIPTLESQGFAGLSEVVNMLNLLVPKNMPAEQYATLRDLVVAAAKSSKVQKSYSVDYCEPSSMTLPATQRWFDSQVVLWKRLSQAVDIDK